MLRFLPILILALTHVVVAAEEPQRPTPTATRPMNILLISIDTLRADHLGFYGYFRNTSPNLDKLAEKSIVFEACLTPLATTLPAHTSVLTATYPLEHGVLANVRAGGVRFQPVDGLRSFAEFAANKGYRTAAFVSGAPLGVKTGIATGFQTFDEPTGAERSAGLTNSLVLNWLEQDASGPFFLFVHYFDPHYPYEPPAPFDREFGPSERLETHMAQRQIPEAPEREIGPKARNVKLLSRYDGEIRYVDWHISRLIESLEQADLWDDTAVIVMSDHGEGFGEHGLVGHGYVYREQLHVPLIMHIPGQKPRQVGYPVSLVDTLPTALSMIGGDWSEFLAQSSGYDVLAEGYEPLAVFSQRTARSRDTLKGRVYSLATSRWKYISESRDRDRLFHWSSDPFELEDVIEGNLDVGRLFKGNLRALVYTYDARGRALASETRETDDEVDDELMEKLRALGYVD
jgi:arylsulfatase A-like enzyme